MYSWKKFLRAVPRMESKFVELGSIELLKALIYERSTITLVGKFVHDVLEVGEPVGSAN
jgi:hypothetical protein